MKPDRKGAAVSLTIDGREVTVAEGRTVLDAARELGIEVPTLCHGDGLELFTSCMLCVVREAGSGRLIPACSAPASQGMVVETGGEEVRAARRDALEFLLSEHVGDCEAPCRRGCPAHMDIPLMIRLIGEGRGVEAAAVVKREIALPAILGRICPAPCEKACKRAAHDDPLAIRRLKRFAADVDLARPDPDGPVPGPASGKRVAVIGSGPAGLTAATYLALDGHLCHVYDDRDRPGGMLRRGVPEADLPRSVLDAEIARISALGVEFHMGRSLGKDLALSDLRRDYDALVLTMGEIDPAVGAGLGFETGSRGLRVDRATLAAGPPGVFAAGSCVSPSRMAVRAAAQGKTAARSADLYLRGEPVAGAARRFNSVMGRPEEGEIREFLKEAADAPRTAPTRTDGGFTDEEARKEAARCFGCDCRKPDACRLRRFADEYGAGGRLRGAGRRSFRRVLQHEQVVYEPGKCIRCGLCVRITRRAGEALGLTFVGRGFEVEVETPFNRPLGQGLEKAAAECVAACPTAALSWRDRSRSST